MPQLLSNGAALPKTGAFAVSTVLRLHDVIIENVATKDDIDVAT